MVVELQANVPSDSAASVGILYADTSTPPISTPSRGAALARDAIRRMHYSSSDTLSRKIVVAIFTPFG